VEHALAHAGRRQGRRARYRGVRNNLYDWRRASALTNLETLQRRLSVRHVSLVRVVRRAA